MSDDYDEYEWIIVIFKLMIENDSRDDAKLTESEVWKREGEVMGERGFFNDVRDDKAYPCSSTISNVDLASLAIATQDLAKIPYGVDSGI